LKEEGEFVSDANLEHVLEISRQRAATKEAGRRLMEAKRQKLAELNAHRHYETFARKHVRRVEIEASRKRL
jgi:sigma54-dependent transcription regulator